METKNNNTPNVCPKSQSLKILIPHWAMDSICLSCASCFYPLNFLTSFVQVFSKCFSLLFGPIIGEVCLSCSGSWKQVRVTLTVQGPLKASMHYVWSDSIGSKLHTQTQSQGSRKVFHHKVERERMMISWIIEFMTLKTVQFCR